MNNTTELINKCKILPYSLTYQADKTTIESTQAEICNMAGQYGYSDVYASLASLWSVEQTADYFDQIKNELENKRGIRTIATCFYRAYDGGTERVNAELMKLWTEMGLNVVFLTDEPENPLDYDYPDSVKRFQIPGYDDIRGRLKTVERICNEEHVDLFVNHNWNHPMFIWECALLKTMGVRYVQYCHGHFAWSLSQGREGLFQNKTMKYCDLVVALSESSARYYQMTGCETYLLNNPVPSDLNDVVVASLESNHVIMVGRISWEKYPMEAMQIINIVHKARPNIIFDIVGSGVMEKELRDYTVHNHLDEVVIFHGNKSVSEVEDLYKNSACELLTSKMEGYSMVVLEAKAHGIPVVMYDLPYLSLVKDGKGIVTATVGNIQEMADNLVHVMDDIEYRRRLGKAARESFEAFQNYDLESNWRCILNLLSGNETELGVSYYGQDIMLDADKYIIPIMLDQIKKSYDTLLDSSLNYRVGKKILYIPNQLKKIIKDWKQR